MDGRPMKKIETLIEDIYGLFEKDIKIPEELVNDFAHDLARLVDTTITDNKRAPYLRMSMLGSKCHRKLWYSLNCPEEGEPLTGQTKFKFLYGHVLEALVLFLAKAAGHSVEGQQDQLDISGVKGHRDAIIDGMLVDVKSASSYGFKKFKEHGLMTDDPFGYLDQLGAYLYASQEDPLLLEKQKAAFLAIDKVLGGMVLDVYPKKEKNYDKHVEKLRLIVQNPKAPPRGFEDIPDGKSGNMKLGVECSYCEFKKTCWPGLKVYQYSRGPVFLTKVLREPRVVEAENF